MDAAILGEPGGLGTSEKRDIRGQKRAGSTYR
jgi:hypothetical protein